MNKKRILFSIIMLFTVLTFARETKDRNTVGLQFSLGGTIPLYGDANLWNNHEQMNSNKYGRFIFGTDAGMTVRLAEPLHIVLGTDACFDFTGKDKNYLNSIDFAFCGGFQFYPNLGNLSFTIAYALGYRADFVKLPSDYSELKKVKWGNGFKLAAEYDIFAGGGIIPVVGVSYRFMPRGYEEYDNILSIYFRLAFR